MKLTSHRGGMLHLQMGQETIYLLLTSSLFISMCLLIYVMKLQGREEQPPIITLRETAGFRFAAGSTGVSPRFVDQLDKVVVPQLRSNAGRYKAHVIEVIGHTDEQAVHPGSASNLDSVLIPELTGRTVETVHVADNVGLGMARAVAVARVLRQLGLGSEYRIIPLSAGPVLRPDDTVTDGTTPKDDADRRRIELRLRRSLS